MSNRMMTPSTGAPPNIVLFVTDDHARWALPVYGNGAVEMPSVAGLARRGTVFEDAYTTSPVCSPARASLMTGLMPSAHGVHDFLASNPVFDDKDWLAAIPTLAERLAAVGYYCGLVGKWHVGRDSTPQPGFHSWFALNGEYPIEHDGDNGFSRNGAEERHVGNLTEVITEGAKRFVQERDRAKPFLLVVGYYATHSPWTDQPERLVERYADHDFSEIDTAGEDAKGIINVELPCDDAPTRHAARAHYYAAAAHIDEGVGEIVAALESQGVLNETVLVYTADHGLSLGQHGIWGKGNATRPPNLLDESIRVPLIVAGPGVPAGARTSGFTDHIDTHNRLLTIAGLPADPASMERAFQFCEYGTVRMVRTATHKLICWTTGAAPQLFEVGPGRDETIEVSGKPGSASIIDHLRAALEAFFASVADPERSGAASLQPLTFNFNQAWDPFVPR